MRAYALIIALVSAPAFACPKLGGAYKVCRTNNSESTTINEMVIDQKIVNKYYQFTFSTKEVSTDESRIEKYTADGKLKITTETDPETGVTIKTSTSTWCTEDILNIKVDALVDSEALANLTIQTTKVGNTLTQTLIGNSMGQPVNETIICE